MMTDTLQWRKLLTVSSRSVKTYGAPVVVPGYWEQKLSQKIDPNGNWVATSGVFYCGGVFNIGLQDDITMDNGTKPPIAFLATLPDENGPYATVVTLGR
jgi:hypothetical protein